VPKHPGFVVFGVLDFSGLVELLLLLLFLFLPLGVHPEGSAAAADLGVLFQQRHSRVRLFAGDPGRYRHPPDAPADDHDVPGGFRSITGAGRRRKRSQQGRRTPVRNASSRTDSEGLHRGRSRPAKNDDGEDDDGGGSCVERGRSSPRLSSPRWLSCSPPRSGSTQVARDRIDDDSERHRRSSFDDF